jgi:hypothetical protein
LGSSVLRAGVIAEDHDGGRGANDTKFAKLEVAHIQITSALPQNMKAATKDKRLDEAGV